MQLEFYLIMPVQRITRYRLLVEEIMRQSDASDIDADIAPALALIAQRVEDCNSAVSASAQGLPHPATSVSTRRQLLHHGSLYCVQAGHPSAEIVAYLLERDALILVFIGEGDGATPVCQRPLRPPVRLALPGGTDGAHASASTGATRRRRRRRRPPPSRTPRTAAPSSASGGKLAAAAVAGRAGSTCPPLPARRSSCSPPAPASSPAGPSP